MALEFIPLIFKNKSRAKSSPVLNSQAAFHLFTKVTGRPPGGVLSQINAALYCTPGEQRHSIMSRAEKNNPFPKLFGLREVGRSDHHERGSERVARAFKIVPLDSVEFSDVLSLSVVHTVQVGRTAGVVPPS